jgi:hypothetical protein
MELCLSGRCYPADCFKTCKEEEVSEAHPVDRPDRHARGMCDILTTLPIYISTSVQKGTFQ